MKKIIPLIICFFAICYVLTDPWSMNKLDEVLPEFDSYYHFNEDERWALNETLDCFGLDTLSSKHFFSFRYAYYWEDGCAYRSVSDFICETGDFLSCYELFYKSKDGEIVVERKIIPEDKARRFKKEIVDLNSFVLKSVKKEQFFVYLGFMQVDGFVDKHLFEIADKTKANRFSIGTMKSSNKSYVKLMSVLSSYFHE